MIKLDKPIIVEGKYDKITLENVVDGLIIPTDGFGIFKNKEKRDLIRTLAKRFGLIVITDSDGAGNMIRSHIKNIAGECEIINVYVPRISGKEKRKDKCGKEGILGVEGMTTEILENALMRSGVTATKCCENVKKITKADLYYCGLSGGKDSSDKRKSLLKYLSLPENLSPNAMLDILNTLYSYGEFSEVTKKWQDSLAEN